MEAIKQRAEATITHNGSTCALPLCGYVKQTVEAYFNQLNGHDVNGLYALVMSEVEKPLLEATLAHSGHNQTKAAKVLGLSRSTLRKKMEQYGLS